MPAFSASLDQSLRRVRAIARERRNERVMLDHLLLALIDDPDASAVMRGCNVDLDELRRPLEISLGGVKPASGDLEPTMDSEVEEVIQAAVNHIESIGRELVTGAHVLVEILDRWPGSFLQAQGMTRYHAVRFLTHGLAEDAAIPPEQDGESEAAMFRVLLLNDDYTPMEFVVHVLEHLFDMDRKDAVRVMMYTHCNGSGECGVYARETAAAKIREVMDLARQHQHPL